MLEMTACLLSLAMIKISGIKIFSIVLSPQYLTYSPIDVAAELKGIYSSLFKAIHEIWLKLSDKTTLLVIDKKQSIVDTHIAQIKVSSVVHAYNDIELFDWARGNQSCSLWYCDYISKSPTLKSVIVKALYRRRVTVRLSQGCFQKKQHQLDINLWDLSLHTQRKETTLLDFIRAHLWFFKQTSNTPTL